MVVSKMLDRNIHISNACRQSPVGHRHTVSMSLLAVYFTSFTVV